MNTALPPACPLFEGIPADKLPGLLDCLQAQRRSFGKGETIFAAGQPASQVGVVLTGEVQLWQEDFFGNRTIYNRFGPGEIFGEVYAFSVSSHAPASAVAVQPTEALLIDRARLLGRGGCVGPYHLPLVENLTELLAKRGLYLSEKLSVLSRRTLREKLLAYLSQQARQAGKCRFVIPYSRQELADYLAVDRSALSKELSRMRQEGLVDYRRNEFSLHKEPCRAAGESAAR